MGFFQGFLAWHVGLLKQFPDFETVGTDIGFAYEPRPDAEELRRTHRLEAMAGTGDEFSRLVNLMKWLGAAVRYDGGSMEKQSDALHVLAASANEGKSFNCRAMATALSEVYLACGFASRFVGCNPYDPTTDDCHVVTITYSETFGKWIMFDPTYPGYITNERREPLSLEEIRRSLVEDQALLMNGQRTPEGDEHIAYMAKNLFHFDCFKTNCFVPPGPDGVLLVRLSPVGFDGRAYQLRMLEWSAEKWKPSEEMLEKQRVFYMTRTLYTHDASAYWATPAGSAVRTRQAHPGLLRSRPDFGAIAEAGSAPRQNSAP